MSEARLWDRLRAAVGHAGHFARVENAVGPGYPDVNYCVKTVEGHIELKFRFDEPKRIDTAVFGNGGLRDDQIAWISTRCRHGGRVWILVQVKKTLYLLPGSCALVFNSLTCHDIDKMSTWSATGNIPAGVWTDLVTALTKGKAQ